MFILGISGACSNYVPLIALEIGIKENSIFYLFSSSTYITAILAIAGGITIDKFNKKKLFQIDIIFFIVILLLYCSTHPTVFIIAIIISGLSSALNNVGNSYIFTNYLEDEINCFWGVIGSISLVSFSIGSIICGILYQINYRYVFIFSIVLNILGLLMSIGMKDIEKGDKNSK